MSGQAIGDDRVAVRMYRNILGDCFLIRAMADGKPWHALVDFGILQGSPNRAALHDAIVADLLATTGGVAGDAARKGRIDLLICTHEHADHLSGFGHAWDRFFGDAADFEVDRVWLAWTEDLTDPDASVLQAGKLKALRALRVAAAAATQDKGLAQSGEGKQLSGLMRFVPGADDSGDGFALAGGKTVATVMKGLRERPNVSFLQPGRTHAAGPFAVHVLGPPRATDRLSRSDPRRGENREVYLTRPEMSATVEAEGTRRLRAWLAQGVPDGATPEQAALFATAAATLSAAATEPDSLAAQKPVKPPFAARYAMTVEPDAPLDSLVGRYFDPGNDWRQISTAWLNAASELALKLDSDTNNTSLALAFTLPDGQVLLFPADAQVGNWQSWSDQQYPATPDAEQKISIDDILGRVTLYKVGHHASHNATLRIRGLELMNDPRLSAMIPVDETVARSQEWAMPFPPLEARLREKTSGRLIQGDGDPSTERAAFAGSGHAQIDHDAAGTWVEILLPVTRP